MTNPIHPDAEEPAIDEASYIAGSQRAWATMLSMCLRELSPGEPRPNDWAVVELTEARVALRRVCAEFGDNDWPDDLHLGDVIEKHLERHLGDEHPPEPKEQAEGEPQLIADIRRNVFGGDNRPQASFFMNREDREKVREWFSRRQSKPPSPAKEPSEREPFARLTDDETRALCKRLAYLHPDDRQAVSSSRLWITTLDEAICRRFELQCRLIEENERLTRELSEAKSEREKFVELWRESSAAAEGLRYNLASERAARPDVERAVSLLTKLHESMARERIVSWGMLVRAALDALRPAQAEPSKAGEFIDAAERDLNQHEGNER